MSRIDEVRKMVSEVLKVPLNELPQDASLDSTNGWDSMAQLNICMRFQEQFRVRMSIADIERCTNIQSFVAMIP